VFAIFTDFLQHRPALQPVIWRDQQRTSGAVYRGDVDAVSAAC
jgi:hypothetical protein